MSRISISAFVEADKYGATEVEDDAPITDETHMYVDIGGITVRLTIGQWRELVGTVDRDIEGFPAARLRRREMRAGFEARRAARQAAAS